MASRRVLIAAGGGVVALGAAAAVAWWSRPQHDEAPLLSYEELTGSLFPPSPPDPRRPPQVREIALPAVPNANAIWGATGRDARGRVWFGVSATGHGAGAHLLEYDAASARWHDHGAVTARLAAAGLRREREGQSKIHSKIVPGGDGWLYFASTDEEGEDEARGTPPRWGGHLWRVHPQTREWQHLLATREGLVAVSGVGRYVYALGYWGHVLYRFDTQARSVRRAEVASAGAHVSRNFVADVRGHVFVPRVRMRPDGSATAELVEFDATLTQVAATALDVYLGNGAPAASHGLTALAYLPDGDIVVATHRGHLYRIAPRPRAAADVSPLGWMHPQGESYAASLFAWGGSQWIAGVTMRDRFEWVVRDLRTMLAVAHPIEPGRLRNVALYGSIARDNAGRAYVGGWALKDEGSAHRPLLLQIDPA